MGKETVFSRLHSQSRSSMSLAHFFYFGATVRQADDLKSAVAYAASNYDYVDGKALGSLEALLESTTPESPLPAFTFVHLIGVDAISHRFGPASREARDYLASVDRELGRLCDRVLTLESEGIRPIILLTAEHGFTTVRRFADLEGWIGKEAPGTTVLNEGRFLGLRFPSPLDESQRSALLARASTASRNVAWTLQRAGNRVWIRGPGIQASFEYSEGACDSSTSPVHPIRWQGGNALCPADLDRVAMSPFPPYFFSNVATYFESRYHPDALILAADHVLFSRGYKGAHGGLTLEELLVPVLARNADLHPTRALSEPSSFSGS